jgi:hypothetical protein
MNQVYYILDKALVYQKAYDIFVNIQYDDIKKILEQYNIVYINLTKLIMNLHTTCGSNVSDKLSHIYKRGYNNEYYKYIEFKDFIYLTGQFIGNLDMYSNTSVSNTSVSNTSVSNTSVSNTSVSNTSDSTIGYVNKILCSDILQDIYEFQCKLIELHKIGRIRTYTDTKEIATEKNNTTPRRDAPKVTSIETIYATPRSYSDMVISEMVESEMIGSDDNSSTSDCRPMPRPRRQRREYVSVVSYVEIGPSMKLKHLQWNNNIVREPKNISEFSDVRFISYQSNKPYYYKVKNRPNKYYLLCNDGGQKEDFIYHPLYEVNEHGYMGRVKASNGADMYWRWKPLR